jgi:hypothetical protein
MGMKTLCLVSFYAAILWTATSLLGSPGVGVARDDRGRSSEARSLRGRVAGDDRGRRSEARSEWVLLLDGDKRDHSGASSSVVFFDFDLVDALGAIIDHPRQFLEARYVNIARVLSQNVTAPMFTNAQTPLLNKTTDLGGWLHEDTRGICTIVIPATRNAIMALTQQERGCSASDDIFGNLWRQGGQCAARKAMKRGELLSSAQQLLASMRLACDKLLPNTASTASGPVATRKIGLDSGYSLLGFLEDLKYGMRQMEEELKVLYGVMSSLTNSGIAFHEIPLRISRILRQLDHTGYGYLNLNRAKLDILASTAVTGQPGDLDLFTSVLLHIIHGSPNLFPPTLRTDTDHVPPPGPPREIRYKLKDQAKLINATTEFIDSAILPGARKWLRLMREVNDSGALDTRVKEESNFSDDLHWYVSPALLWHWWADPNKADRMVKAVEDGADRLEVLRRYLGKLQHDLPGILTRLDRWDAEVTALSDDLTSVLLWGKKYTQRRQKPGKRQTQTQGLREYGTISNSGGGGDELEITRWQIHPSSTRSLQKGLYKLERQLNESLALLESFNSQDAKLDNWFERNMNKWNSKRAVLRAEWEVEQAHKERARRTFWQHVRNMLRTW